MIDQWKARLRAWLIELVREAIRIERTIEQPQFILATPRPNGFLETLREAREASKPASKPVTIEPDFEQMQAAAIHEQEKFYEPSLPANGSRDFA